MSSAEDHARSMGFSRPLITVVRLRRGESFLDRGHISTGQPYAFRYAVEHFSALALTLSIHGEIGPDRSIHDVLCRFPLIANRPLPISRFVSADEPLTHLAFLALNAADFHPVVDDELVLALTQIRSMGQCVSSSYRTR